MEKKRRKITEGIGSRIAAQKLGIRHLKSRKDGARPKRGRRLATTVGTVAYVERQWLGHGGFEGHGATLT